MYRDGERVTDEPVTENTNYFDPDGESGAVYAVERVDADDAARSDSVEAWDEQYKRIPMNRPGPVEAAAPGDDSMVAYHANDASVGDLTGDGSLDIVLKWSPENAKDNAHERYTNQTIFDAYPLDGTHLWRVELGPNVRAGAHYAQFLVYDFDGDGRAEMAVRTGDGTVDGEGTVIGDPDADYRNETGRILEGPEYFTVFDGETGEALTTVDYEPARGDVSDWGDDYGNRSDRFLACVAYLDGERPSIVNARGYYEKTMLVAYDFRDGELSQRWVFDSTEGNEAYEGQGNHQVSVADVDGDGRDEIVYGACVVDDDGTGLYSTGWMHGDALHCGDFLPDREGLEVSQVHEPENAPHGASMREAATGELIWREPDSEAIRLYATPHETDHRIPTLLHDPQYRLALAWQNVAYNQPPHPSFFLGVDMDEPPRADLDFT